MKVDRRDSFGGPEILNIREVPAPHAGPGQIRVRVKAAGLNPMDWFMTADAATAGRFGLSLPAGFGTDYAGVVDQVGDGVTGFAPGDRVFGGPCPARSPTSSWSTRARSPRRTKPITPPTVSTTAPPPPSRSPAARHPPP